MSSAKHSRHGPRPTRCITCWQRRKQCDSTEPSCERCLKGGFECLGYGDRESHARLYRKVPCGLISQSQPIHPTLPMFLPDAEALPDPGTTKTSGDIQSLNHVDDSFTHSSTGCIPVLTENRTGIHSLEIFNSSWPQNQTQPTPRRRAPLHETSSIKNSPRTKADIQFVMRHISKSIEFLCTAIPPPVFSAQTPGESRFIHMLNDYQMQRSSFFFMPPPAQARVYMMKRLSNSRITKWALYLGVRIFGALGQDRSDWNTGGYIGWIDKFEQRIVHSTIKNSSLSDLADRLMAQLELTYLGFIAAGSTLGYQLLQKALPGFLRLVAADPNLIAEQPDGGLLVSFPRAFGTSPQEIKRFIIYDMATGFLLGVPPLLEYDYYGKCDPVSHGSEWIHGVPAPLVEIISQINSWRAGFKVPLDDWRVLESRVMAWEVQPLPIEDGDSRMNVARLAIQEGWRHVVLIYIYMGICGVSSHDSRVQASIAQIIQLEGIVAGLPISIHMLMHYVVAGMGARYEQQRSIIRQKLVSFKGKGAWLFQGPEFTQILDHLWHGAGAGGAPVMWDDYVQSRCTVIHI
ncbi:unnamed protein product [Rhizoctonia solani]|uniref:Zn(2)-C6 fungal-type domain-containing protein n=1 Tax=Rhizoctonia solani TaxID=456999 RepID=A0A8H2X155_9AGAM|nr:unnamed protein product [Rhizoctonia solani]